MSAVSDVPEHTAHASILKRVARSRAPEWRVQSDERMQRFTSRVAGARPAMCDRMELDRQGKRPTMDLADVMLHLFGLARDWSARARGFAFLLSLPILVITIADWRIRRRR